MNKQKQTYLSPETETLVVRFEGVICTSDVINVINLLQSTEYIENNPLDYDEL